MRYGREGRALALLVLMLVAPTILAASLVAPGEWRVAIHGPYLNTHYQRCVTGTTIAWALAHQGSACRPTPLRVDGRRVTEHETCRQPLGHGTALVTHILAVFQITADRQAMTGTVQARVRSPVGVLHSTETVAARRIAATCTAG
ncbi:MAG: hypothetical protein ACYCXG_09840 [Acidiferrobacter sp.]